MPSFTFSQLVAAGATFNPLVGWMWAGVMIMVSGGLISLSDRRHRIGAPSRRPGARLAHATGAAGA